MYMPKDNLLITNIMMLADKDIQEIHIGGIFDFNELYKQKKFWEFAAKHQNEEFQLEIYSYCLYGTSRVTRNATQEELELIIDDEFPNNPEYADRLYGEENNANWNGYNMKPVVLNGELVVLYAPKQSDTLGNIITQNKPPEDNQEKEINEMITAEDLVEQAIYSMNTPDCCKGGQQAENMLGMLGANIIDEDIYHTPDEHKKMEL